MTCMFRKYDVNKGITACAIYGLDMALITLRLQMYVHEALRVHTHKTHTNTHTQKYNVIVQTIMFFCLYFLVFHTLGKIIEASVIYVIVSSCDAGFGSYRHIIGISSFAIS